MNNVLLIFRRELGAYLRTRWGYVIAAVMLLVDGLLFNSFATRVELLSAELLGLFFQVTWYTTMVAGALLSFRLIAEERQTGTIVLLATSPVREWEIIAGKFLSAFTYLAILTLVTIYMPALIFVNGKISAGHVAAGYLGLLLVGGAAVAVGLFGSAVSRSQLVAAIAGGAILVALSLLFELAPATDPPLTGILEQMSMHPFKHFSSFQRGILSTTDVLFYLSLTYVFLLAATKTLAARRWR